MGSGKQQTASRSSWAWSHGGKPSRDRGFSVWLWALEFKALPGRLLIWASLELRCKARPQQCPVAKRALGPERDHPGEQSEEPRGTLDPQRTPNSQIVGRTPTHNPQKVQRADSLEDVFGVTPHSREPEPLVASLVSRVTQL